MHRDVKFASILLDRGHPILADLGSAQGESGPYRLLIVITLAGHRSPRSKGDRRRPAGRCALWWSPLLVHQDRNMCLVSATPPHPRGPGSRERFPRPVTDRWDEAP